MYLDYAMMSLRILQEHTLCFMQGEIVMTQQLWSACSSYHETGNVQYVHCLQVNAHVFTCPKAKAYPRH